MHFANILKLYIVRECQCCLACQICLLSNNKFPSTCPPPPPAPPALFRSLAEELQLSIDESGPPKQNFFRRAPQKVFKIQKPFVLTNKSFWDFIFIFVNSYKNSLLEYSFHLTIIEHCTLHLYIRVH